MPAQVGSLRVTLGANTAQFEQGMRRAQNTARATGQNIERSLGGMSARISQSFAGIRIAAAGLGLTMGASFLVQEARQAFDFAAGLSETSRAIGVTVEQLQILRRAAIDNGASVEGMERAMSILQRTLGNARAEIPAAVQAFRSLGINPEQFATSGQALRSVMEAIRGLRTQSEQAAAAQRLFGRGAAELIPFLVQGAEGYDRMAREARESGLVTAEQARAADEAADRLAALATTLRTNLASALADTIPTITSVIETLRDLGNMAAWAMNQVSRVTPPSVSGAASGAGRLVRNMAIMGPFGLIPTIREAAGNVFGGGGAPGPTNIPIRDAPPTTGDTDLDLSPSGGRGRGGGGADRAEAERKRRLREDQEYQSDLRREQISQLEEQRQRTNDFVEQNTLQAQINGLNSEQYRSEIALKVALGDLNRERASALLLARGQTELEQGISLVTSERLERVRELATVDENEYNLAREAIQQQEGLADTAEERRRIQIELLELDYRYRRLKLQNIVRETQAYDLATRLDAQQQLDALPASRAAAMATARRNTRGPLEEYLGGLPTTAARAQEALEGVAVNGLQSITDGLTEAIMGTRKWGDVFKNVAAGIISDLIRIQIQQRLIPMISNGLNSILGGGGGPNTSLAGANSVLSAFGGLFGNLPGRATGGPVLPGRMYMVGEKGPELLRMGGSAGHIIANDNIGGGGIVINQTFAPNFAGNAATREEVLFLAAKAKSETLDAVRQASRRRS